MDSAGAPEREALRGFLKRLPCLAPSLSFESLVDRELDDELAEVAWESVQSFMAGPMAAAQVGQLLAWGFGSERRRGGSSE
ncbi:hypothetical protein [Nocardia asteroides]|uniref:hypothetical protein n=1 Tax=Nocardia asteroides TaxID=1824 RepID=UPI0033E7A648